MRQVALLVLALAASVSALELRLDPRSITEALRIGQSRLDSERASFHAPYRLPVGTAPIDYIEVVTPFRRVALASEQRRRLGERSLSQRQAIELLDSAPHVIDIVVELTFHPLHALVRVPEYQVRLIPARGASLEARSTDRVPRFGPRLDGMPVPLPGTPTIGTPRTAQPMLGGSVIAAYDGLTLDAGVYDVAVLERGKQLARTRVDFGRLR